MVQSQDYRQIDVTKGGRSAIGQSFRSAVGQDVAVSAVEKNY